MDSGYCEKMMRDYLWTRISVQFYYWYVWAPKMMLKYGSFSNPVESAKSYDNVSKRQVISMWIVYDCKQPAKMSYQI